MMPNPVTFSRCPVCYGTGKDPKKRTRKCPQCDGRGRAAFCTRCGQLDPCPGIPTNVIDGTCLRVGRSDPRTGDEIRSGVAILTTKQVYDAIVSSIVEEFTESENEYFLSEIEKAAKKYEES